MRVACVEKRSSSAAAAWAAEMRHTRALGAEFPGHEALWAHRRALVALWVHRLQPSCAVGPPPPKS